MTKSIVDEKAYSFAIKIIGCYKNLCEVKREYVLSKQLLRSGTSIGANIREGMEAVSIPDFINKLGIALKEARESEYWLSLLKDTGYLEIEEADVMINESIELVKILKSIIKTTKANHLGI